MTKKSQRKRRERKRKEKREKEFFFHRWRQT
jgi:hypothetical protein